MTSLESVPNIQTLLVSAAAAFATALVATQLSARGLLWLRERSYRRFKRPPGVDDHGRKPKLTADEKSAFAKLQSMSDLLRSEHDAARELQDRYHECLARVVAATFMAFCIGALHLAAISAGEYLHYFLLWLDPFLIAIVFVIYKRSRHIRREWIAARSLSELQRQYIYLDLLAPLLPSTQVALDITSRYQAERERTRSLLANVATSAHVEEEIFSIWKMRAQRLSDAAASGTLRMSTAHLYVRLRPQRQRGWFESSLHRLHYELKLRERRLRILFVAVAALLILKLLTPFLEAGILALAPEYEPAVRKVVATIFQFAPPALLVLIGISATYTAYAMGRNARSLLHRYNSQQRSITRWLEGFNFQNVGDPSEAEDLAKSDAPEFAKAVVEFEKLMIEELLDWIHITDYDALELAP